jgi:hypothetical protein
MSRAFPNSFYLTNMDTKPIYVAKPPAMYIAPLWDFERGRSSPVLSSVCSEDPRTVGESSPIPKKPCIYGAVGDGRPNPSISARRRSHTVPLCTFSPKGMPVILPEDTDHGAVGNGRPKPPAEHFASYIRSLMPDVETPARSSLQPGDLIYLTTPRGPRYYYERRLITDNLVNYIPNTRSRRGRSRTDSNSNKPPV